MSVTVANKTSRPVLFLSPMHINEGAIKGHMPTDKTKTQKQKEKEYKDNMRNLKKRVVDYICSVMLKVKEDGPRCVKAAYHFG